MNDCWAENDSSKTERRKKSKKNEKKITKDVYIILYLQLSCNQILGKSFQLSESMSHRPHQSWRGLPPSLLIHWLSPICFDPSRHPWEIPEGACLCLLTAVQTEAGSEWLDGSVWKWCDVRPGSSWTCWHTVGPTMWLNGEPRGSLLVLQLGFFTCQQGPMVISSGSKLICVFTCTG